VGVAVAAGVPVAVAAGVWVALLTTADDELLGGAEEAPVVAVEVAAAGAGLLTCTTVAGWLSKPAAIWCPTWKATRPKIRAEAIKTSKFSLRFWLLRRLTLVSLIFITYL
jgi:hypothetical protein